jgi:two-component system alkaline phosphatase synthesis response regulator PhoP
MPEGTKLQRVLIIEDEPDMVLGLRDNFEFEGYDVLVARDGSEGLKRAISDNPDVILLDIMLPRMSGLDVCRQLRSNGVDTPIIMLTARGQEVDKVIGLEMGADDYVTKPFSIKELLARVRAHLRRAKKQVADIETYNFGDVNLNFKKYYATKGEREIDLSPREFELLKYFIQHRGETITRDQLLDDVWGYDNYPFTRTVDNHIAKLRQKVEAVPADPKYIITVHRVGYKFLG